MIEINVKQISYYYKLRINYTFLELTTVIIIIQRY